MKERLISIILLTYKKFQYFEECINSILIQRYSNIELVISDDGSENFNKEKICSFIEQNKRENIKNVIIKEHESNVGTVRNFNDAVKLSSGEYIIGIGIDDVFFDENVIENVVKAFDDNSCDILITYRSVYNRDLSKNLGLKPELNEIELIKGNTNKLYKALCKESFISGAGTSYTRKFLEKEGYFDEEYKLCEDYPTFLRASRKGYKFYFLNVPTIKYRLDGISTQSTVHPILDRDMKYAIKKEILPYRQIIGMQLYRIKKFELDKYDLKTKKDLISYRLKLGILIIKNVDIAISKTWRKIINRIGAE